MRSRLQYEKFRQWALCIALMGALGCRDATQSRALDSRIKAAEQRVRHLEAVAAEREQTLNEQTATLNWYFELVEETLAMLAQVSQQERELIRLSGGLEGEQSTFASSDPREEIQQGLGRIRELLDRSHANAERLTESGRFVEGLMAQIAEKEQHLIELTARIEQLETTVTELESSNAAHVEEARVAREALDDLSERHETLQAQVPSFILAASARDLDQLRVRGLLLKRGVVRETWSPTELLLRRKSPTPGLREIDGGVASIYLGRGKRKPVLLSAHQDFETSWRIAAVAGSWQLQIREPRTFWSAGRLVVVRTF